MKNVTIKIGDTVHEKMRPTVTDWFSNIDFTEEIRDKNVILDKDAAMVAIRAVADWFALDADELVKSGDLQEIISAYYQIQRNIVETFTIAAELPVKNVKAPAVKKG